MSDLTLGEILAGVLAAPPPAITRASGGDLDGLTEVAAEEVNAAFDREGVARLVMLSQGLAFGRLAMAHGKPADAHAVVSLYGEIAALCRELGDHAAGDSFEGQGIALAEMLADAGDDDMADLVAANASLMTAGALREAKRLTMNNDNTTALAAGQGAL